MVTPYSLDKRFLRGGVFNYALTMQSLGQALGLVGNSGNSTEPHLHFHISDGNSPLASEGLPYALASFEVQGKGWGWKPASANPSEKREMEMPLELEVVRFPSGR